MEQNGRIILVASGKGGSGKSTFSVNCGARLAQRGHKVLIVDADVGLRSLDLMLSVSDKAVFDLADALSHRCEPEKAVTATGIPDLFLVPAPQSDCDDIGNTDIMTDFYKKVSAFYDYIIIDSPAGIGKTVTAPAGICDCAIVVSDTQPVCIRSAGHLASILREKGARNLRLVLNRIDANLIRKDKLPNIDAAIDGTAVQLIGIVPDDKRVIEASVCGKPVEKGGAAAAFTNIAARLDGENVPLMKL